MELVRFTNSGTEANLMALALAVHHTGRREILAFKGGYHGGVLAFGSGEPSAVTVPHAWVMGDYDAVEETRALIRVAQRSAAILVEPMLGSGGCLPASREFLEMLREEATATGAVLIFDEVMTSRLGPSGVGPRPDDGRQVPGGRDVVRRLRRAPRADGGLRPDAARGALPRRHVQQQRALDERRDRGPEARADRTRRCTDLNARGDRLREALNRVAAERDVPVRTTGRGSLMTIHAGERGAAAAAVLRAARRRALARRRAG